MYLECWQEAEAEEVFFCITSTIVKHHVQIKYGWGLVKQVCHLDHASRVMTSPPTNATALLGQITQRIWQLETQRSFWVQSQPQGFETFGVFKATGSLISWYLPWTSVVGLSESRLRGSMKKASQQSQTCHWVISRFAQLKVLWVVVVVLHSIWGKGLYSLPG